MILLLIKRDGISNDDFMLQAANFNKQGLVDKAYDMFKSALKNKEGRTQLFSSDELDIAISLINAGKPKDVLGEVYSDSPFEFLADFDKVAKVDRSYAVEFLKKMALRKDLTALQVTMIAVKAGLESEFLTFAKEAFDEQLEDVVAIQRSDLREHPEYYGGLIDRTLIALSLLTDSSDFIHEVEKLRGIIETVGFVPARGLGIEINVSTGSFSVEHKSAYVKLAQIFLAGLLDRIKSSGCDGYIYDRFIETDQLKELIWSAILLHEALPRK